MDYVSTRGGGGRFSAAQAIMTGLAPDGGLLVPSQIPQPGNLGPEDLASLDYQSRAVRTIAPFLTDYSVPELEACVQAAYGAAKFDSPAVAPIVALPDGLSVLELWHGPTGAFKDMALQLLPRLLSLALTKTGEKSEIVILVATSGDTGKAALEGFRDVPQTRIVVFFPYEGVSAIQRLQMVTQEGGNVAVAAVEGNFDDAQTGVKTLFSDPAFTAGLRQRGFRLSSANSINWGRLVPQIVYYFSAYAELVNQARVKPGQTVNFVVPTGNFGDILAGYYAKLMGLPVGRLICAANSNNVLTEFLRTGTYNRRRQFHKTLSPSMDILISSNLERLLYHAAIGDTARVSAWMNDLQTQGAYQVEGDPLRRIQETVWSGWASDQETITAITRVYDRHQYLIDPHTAVAWHVGQDYRRTTGDVTPMVIVSTASPFKFNDSVLTAIAGPAARQNMDEFAVLRKLAEVTGCQVPPSLAGLEHQVIRHKTVCRKTEMQAIVEGMLR